MGALHLPDALTPGHITGIVHFVVTQHGHAAALRLRIQEFIGLIQVVAHRLLDEDVLSRPQRIRRRLGVVLRQHHHRIQSGAIQHLTIIGKRVPDAVLRAHSPHRTGGQVTQCRNLEQFRHFRQMRQVHHLCNHAGTDQPDSDWLVSHVLTPSHGNRRRDQTAPRILP